MCVCVISHHMAWLRNGHSCCYGQSSYVRVELQMGGVRKVGGGGVEGEPAHRTSAIRIWSFLVAVSWSGRLYILHQRKLLLG